MNIFIATLTLLLGISINTFAHEGHGKTPGALSSPHGGLIKGTNQLYLELLTTQDQVKIYPLTHDMKPIPLSELKLQGKMTIPRKNKGEDVKFETSNDYFQAKVDAKGSHRYDLEVSVTFYGKTEKIKFTVEPQ